MRMKKNEIKRYKSSLLSSNMYIISIEKQAIIIDPHISEEALKYIKNNLLKIDYIILTHEHYDHISGVNWLKDKFNCKVICNKECAEAIKWPNLNSSKYFDILMELLPKEIEIDEAMKVEPYSCFADITFEENKSIKWKGHKIDLISTPGHSKGSICIVIDDKYLFSGDSLLKDYPTVTRLKGGSLKDYKEKTINFLKSLSHKMLVYPGHFESFRLIEKKQL